MLDLEIAGVPHVAEYLVGQGYGVSRTRTATFGWEGVEQQFETISELANYLTTQLALVRGA